jgi:hypothetical protein
MNRTVLLAAMLWPLAVPATASVRAYQHHHPRIVHASTATLPAGAASDEQLCMDHFGVSRLELDENDREDVEFEPMIDRCIASMHQMK